MSAIRNLQRVVRCGFQAVPVHDDTGELEALLYSRQWRSGAVDVLIVHSHAEAFAYRAKEIDPRTPLTPKPGALLWHCEGTPEFVTDSLLELRPADERTPANSPLWTP